MPTQTLEILIVDDDDGDRKQIKRTVQKAELPWTFTEAASIQDALEACEACIYHCAILDYHLSGQDGLDGITALHEHRPHMAIIMVTGQGDEIVATEAMKRGALDHMSKKNIDAKSIRRCLENAVEKASLLRTVAQQRNELEAFSRVLVHDLMAPIHTVAGFAALIQGNIHDGQLERAALYCSKVINGVERMAKLIRTMQRYTSSEDPVVFEPLDMCGVMIETLTSLDDLIQQRGAKVTYGNLPIVSGTPQLGQLLQNLIGNGIKYCEAEVPLVCVTAKPCDGSLWQFSVKDNGIGIPEENYQEVFEPFQLLRSESRYDGTGLGLATCKKIVECRGGAISCQSEEGQGTTFMFTLLAA